MTTNPRPTPTRRRSRTLKVLLALVVLLPILEIITLILVGRSIGVLWTLVLLVAMAALGAWISRRETGRTYRALRQAVDSGRMPTDEVTDTILVMIGGFLLILPGFLTDIVGLLLVLPFTRPAARRVFQTVVAAQAAKVTRGGAGTGSTGPRRAPGQGQVIEGEVLSEEPPPGTWGQGPRQLDR